MRGKDELQEYSSKQLTVSGREGIFGVFLGSSFPRIFTHCHVGRRRGANQDKINTWVQMIA